MPQSKRREEPRILYPLSSQRVDYGRPGIPSPRRINQHPHFHAAARGLAKRMRKSHPDFVSIKDIGHERDCLACVLDRFQHGRIGFISVHQRIDPIARQQRSLYHTFNDPSQHLEIPSVIRQMALQVFRQTFGLCGLRPVPLKVSAQQSGLMANTIDSENEVHDSPDQGHEPNESHPCHGGTRITLGENRVPSHQHREKQSKPDGSDVPEVVYQITNVYRHCGLFLRLVRFVFNGNDPWQPVTRSSIQGDRNTGAVPSHNRELAESPSCIPVTA